MLPLPKPFGFDQCGLHPTLIKRRALPQSSPTALEMSQEPVHHNPQGPQADQEKPVLVVAEARGLAFSFKEIMLPGFLHPQTNPTPAFPLSFRMPWSWSEAKYKIKVAHSRGGWSGGMPEEGRASPS